MAHYILLMKLTSEGRARMADDPDDIVRAHSEIDAKEVTGLGMYGVLGAYDIITPPAIRSGWACGSARTLRRSPQCR